MKLTVAQVLSKFLKEADVAHVFGVSGHSVFDITDAMYVEPGIEFVPAQIELCASYMANSYAVAGRRLGACLGSSGAGVTNLVTGVAEAHKESTPLLVLGSDVDRDVSGKGASSWHEVPQAEIMQPITKLSRTLREPAQVFDFLLEAHRQATTCRTGPVYLGFPRDVQVAEIDVPEQPWIVPAPAAPAPDSALITHAADDLAAARAPLIIAGGGAYWSGAEKEVRRLAELLGAPVGTPHSKKGLLSERHPLALGTLGFGSYPFAEQAAQESDVILAVGTTFSEGLTQGFGHRVIPEAARIIHVDLDSSEIGKTYPVHLAIVGDAKQVLSALIGELERRGFPKAAPSPRLERIAREKEEWQQETARRGSVAEGPITHWHIYHALREVVPDETVIVGAGCTGEILSRLLATTPVVQSGDFRAIGHALSSAIGVKLALPDKPVVAISGDGSFMMELQELATAVRMGRQIPLLVVDNAAYGNMKRDQVRHYGGRVTGTELLIPNLCELARSFGVRGMRVERPAELRAAIQQTVSAGGPALLDIACPIEGL
jgi:acetolactate synthase I/II/III large subunit